MPAVDSGCAIPVFTADDAKFLKATRESQYNLRAYDGTRDKRVRQGILTGSFGGGLDFDDEVVLISQRAEASLIPPSLINAAGGTVVYQDKKMLIFRTEGLKLEGELLSSKAADPSTKLYHTDLWCNRMVIDHPLLPNSRLSKDLHRRCPISIWTAKVHTANPRPP